MKYLEGFSFFGKKKVEKVKKNWEEQLQDVSNEFDEIRGGSDKYHFIDAQLKSDSFYIANMGTQISFSKRGDEYEASDLREMDLSPGMIGKSDKGIYKIDKETYDKYFKLAEEISNFLDEKSEKSIGKSNTTVDVDGITELDPMELGIEEVNYELSKEVYKEYIGKKFEFELCYSLWDSKNSNKRTIERYELPIKNIRIDYGGSRFYMQIESVGVFGEKTEIWLEGDSNIEYFDFQNNRFYGLKDIIRMSVIKKEKTRKQEREHQFTYPMTLTYEVTPSKYDTIEFLKAMTEILKAFNEQIKR